MSDNDAVSCNLLCFSVIVQDVSWIRHEGHVKSYVGIAHGRWQDESDDSADDPVDPADLAATSGDEGLSESALDGDLATPGDEDSSKEEGEETSNPELFGGSSTDLVDMYDDEFLLCVILPPDLAARLAGGVQNLMSTVCVDADPDDKDSPPPRDCAVSWEDLQEQLQWILSVDGPQVFIRKNQMGKAYMRNSPDGSFYSVSPSDIPHGSLPESLVFLGISQAVDFWESWEKDAENDARASVVGSTPSKDPFGDYH